MNTLAAITNKMSAQPMIAEDIEPLLAVRMIAIEKTEKEFRPVGIGEIIKRVIAKVVARAIRDEVKEVTGSRQCSGLEGACEAAVKAMDQMYKEGKVVIVLDAENAYNNLKRNGAMRTAARELPEAYQILKNFYENPIKAHYNGKSFLIEEGTVQGCPLSTAMYDLGVQPLAKEMETAGIVQIWMVDDLAAAGKPEELKSGMKT